MTQRAFLVMGIVLFGLAVSFDKQVHAAGVVARQQQMQKKQIEQQRKQNSVRESVRQQPIDREGESEILDLAAIWLELESSSEVWIRMMDQGPKEITVEKYLEQFRQKGIRIQKSAAHYVQLLDSMGRQNPGLLQQPFSPLLRFIVIMEYDFDNGMDKDALAHKVLGEKIYQQNKQRLGF